MERECLEPVESYKRKEEGFATYNIRQLWFMTKDRGSGDQMTWVR